ncbi:hypothetical protein [Bacillus phage phiAGATE]|uniref:Uncharacterized protein n=1 Tax=Bacillus phage phiAGATE TaxID=1204533 RepID=L0LC62_9CAUD|nr:hypothetical protein G380_gp130 [Bacillus phage phiAGATE]AGB62780.1 hypothetical protein [Bacillus phage phiAGATE]
MLHIKMVPRKGMTCVSCRTENMLCMDDMLQANYYAEWFECLDCGGEAEVVYKSSRISNDNIKTYTFEAN